MRRLQWILVWVLQILLAALFAIQGVIKLAGSPRWVARFRAWGYPEHFYLFVGVLELAGGVLLLFPRLAKFGALTLFIVMLAAAATHVIYHERQVVTTLVLAALLATVFYLRRDRPFVPRL